MEINRSNTLKRRRSATSPSGESGSKRLHALPSPRHEDLFGSKSPDASQDKSVDDKPEIDGAKPAIRDVRNTGKESHSIQRLGGLLFPKPGPIDFIVTRPEVMEFTGGNTKPRPGTVVEDLATPTNPGHLPTPPESPLTLGSVLDDIRQARRALKKEAAEDGEDLSDNSDDSSDDSGDNSDDSGDDSDVSRLSMRLQPLTLGESVADSACCEFDNAELAMSRDETMGEDELQKDLDVTMDEVEAQYDLHKVLEAALDEIEAEQGAMEEGYAADFED